MTFQVPIILADNVLETYEAGLTVTSEAAGYPISNLIDRLPGTYWAPTSTATQDIDVDKLAPGVAVDFLCIGFHDLGTQTATITVYEDDNSGFTSPTTLGTKSFTSDGLQFLSLTSGTERYNRIRITSLDAACYIGVLFLGKKLTMPVGPEFGYTPDAQRTYGASLVSTTGQFMGSAIDFTERKLEVTFRNIPQTFVASDLLPFLEDYYLQIKPFFVVPDPGNIYGTNKLYYMTPPDDPEIQLSTQEENILLRTWTLTAYGVKQAG